jgi:restriction system protein
MKKSQKENDSDDVSAALQLLAESLHGEVQRINAEGAKAMQNGDYDTAQSVIDFARRLTDFCARVSALNAEWLTLEDLRDKATPAVQEIVSKRFFGRQKSGDITPQEDYCAYILKVLVEMGGRGKTKEVIASVGERMKAVLKPKDYERTASRVKELRWENTTRWARQRMVEDGRLKSNSPNGVWEISSVGREWPRRNAR